MSPNISDEDDPNFVWFTGVPDATPLTPSLTITDEDGSILQETNDFSVFTGIVYRNDTRALEKYLEIGSWAIPRAPDIPPSLVGNSNAMDYFYKAAEDGCVDTLRMLLARGIRESTQFPARIRFKERGYELLHVAAKWGQHNLVQFLLENQPLYAEIHERDPEGRTPILAAAHFYAIKFLADETINPARNERVVNLLLDHGACAGDAVSFENTGKPFETVLTLAARWASADLIRRLIEEGASIHTKVTKAKWAPGSSSHLETFEVDALFIACTFANLDAVKLIIGNLQVTMHGEEISHFQDNRGSFPIHWATQNDSSPGLCRDWLLKEMVPNITSMIDFLLNLDPTTINAQDNEGNTPLHYATLAMGRHNGLFAPVFT